MKDMKNEEGYALVVVILIVVLVMGMLTFFMTASLSNVKQEQAVEENHLKVAAAEMGVEYYISALTNEFNYLVNKDNRPQDPSAVLTEFEQTMVNSGYSEGRSNIEDSYYYSILPDIPFLFDGENIVVDGKVEGANEDGSSHSLQFRVKFPISELIESEETENQGNTGFITIEKPSNLCVDGHIFKGDCYVEQDRYVTGKNEGELTAGKVLYVEGDLITNERGGQGNPPIILKSELYVDGDFKVGNNFTPSEANLFIGNNLEVGNNFEPINSQIYVGGDFNFGPGNTATLKGTTKLCVAGKISDKHRVSTDDNSTIYVSAEFYDEEDSHNFIVVDDEETLKKKCGVSDTSPPNEGNNEPGWIEPITDVHYYEETTDD